MQLRLTRKWRQGEATIGELDVDGAFACFTLEDQVRDGEKIPGRTAIPAGEYRVVITRSQRFQRHLPLLLDVPNFEGVRIHAGNTAADTEGCILVGRTIQGAGIGESRLAIEALIPQIRTVLGVGGSCWIEIKDASVEKEGESP